VLFKIKNSKTKIPLAKARGKLLDFLELVQMFAIQIFYYSGTLT
jgi:hypothetical protein